MPVDGKIDLHLHTTVSDGLLSPTELIQLAHKNGVRRLAVTDHDATDGLPEARAEGHKLGVEVIPGIELSADVPGSEVHMLGLFLEYERPDFQEMLSRFREGRVDRARGMVRKLEALGKPISWQRVQELAGEGSVGRPHIAQALLEAGHVATIPEAFDRFIGRTAPAYVERYKLTPTEAIQLIHAADGVAALAHPRETLGTLDLVPELASAGLDGLEVYYWHDYGPGTIEELLLLADQFDLVPTGGSDFHGFPMGGDKVTNEPGSVDIPPELLDLLWARRERRLGR
jgi:predicted metal-dependent phosphoesterase TrpH